MHKVLIIDDEPWSREVVKALGAWENLQLEVIGEADDGTTALENIRELGPHIVVTDMRMPGLDGVDLLKKMNEQFPKLQIIVMSGYDDFVYLQQAVRSRAVDYLLKPIDQEELNASLGNCIRQLEQIRLLEKSSWSSSPNLPDDPMDTLGEQYKIRSRLDIAEIQSYIDRHFHNPISLETIAQYFFVSKEHLSRSFKNDAGENVSEYITRKRMEKAKELIVERKLAIKNAALMTGYEDIAYFYRVYKRHFGETPGESRQED